MTTIAHVTDLHLNGTAPRRRRLERALAEAGSYHPDHLVVTGDCTAHGNPAHGKELREVLSGWRGPITVVPGNHDGNLHFQDPVPTDLGSALLLPVDTRARYKPLAFRALGRIGKEQLEKIDQMTGFAGRPVLLAMHHGPQAHALHLFDGLVDRHDLLTLLHARPWVHVLCGHDHRCLDIGQVHVAPSVAHHPDPVRIYKVEGGRVIPSYRSPFENAYFA